MCAWSNLEFYPNYYLFFLSLSKLEFRFKMGGMEMMLGHSVVELKSTKIYFHTTYLKLTSRKIYYIFKNTEFSNIFLQFCIPYSLCLGEM
jgi:uncharacterized membrane protein